MATIDSVRSSEVRIRLTEARTNRQERRTDRREDNQDERKARRSENSEEGRDRVRGPGRRRRIQDEITNPSTPSTPSTPTTPPTTTPVTTTPVTVTPSNDLKSLATRYVDSYSKQAGRTLSSDERSTLIADVQDFYSDASRSGRLETLVSKIA